MADCCGILRQVVKHPHGGVLLGACSKARCELRHLEGNRFRAAIAAVNGDRDYAICRGPEMAEDGCLGLDPETEDVLIDRLASRIRDMGLIAPALFFLESNRPIAFMGGQLLHFFRPLLGFVHGEQLALYAALLESEESVVRLIDRLEDISEDLSGEAR